MSLLRVYRAGRGGNVVGGNAIVRRAAGDNRIRILQLNESITIRTHQGI